MKKFYLFVAILAVAAMSASCEKEPKSLDNPGSDNEISFIIGQKTTKAAEIAPAVKTSLIALDTDEETGMAYFLEETVTSLDDFYAPETKGTPIYTENASTALSTFNAVAYKHTGSTMGSVHIPDAAFNYYENKWVHNYGSDPWTDVNNENDESLWFFLRNDASLSFTPGLTTKDSKVYGQMTFNYTSPATAAEQKDIVFAARELTKAEAKNANVLFYHALTAVKFRIGNDANAMINSVKFTGLKNTGTCTVTPFYGSGWETTSNPYGDAEENSKSVDCVSWSASGNGTFTQAFESSDLVDFTNDGTFAESFYSYKTGTSNINTNNLNKADASLIFWFIPQQLSSSVELEVNYTAAGKTKTAILKFGDLAKGSSTAYPTWGAGEMRTYTLKANEAGITIVDEVEDNVKKNIEITNTGSVDEYIRVAVIANWVNANGDVVAACSPSLSLNSGWSKNTNDGFYYFSSAIAPNAVATAPFNTYTAPSTKPTGADHLVMDIAVQAIAKGDYTSNTAAWYAAAGVQF